MRNSYVHGLKNVKHRRWDIILASVVVLFAVLLYVVTTIISSNSQATADNSNNQPIAKVFEAEEVDIFEVRENLFEIDLEGTWEKYEKIPNETGVFRYRAKNEQQGRVLEVFVDSLPKTSELYMTHLLPINQSAGTERVQTDQVSDLCRKFAEIEDTQIVGIVKARWKSIEFDCDVHRYRNIVGTSTTDGYPLAMKGEGGAQHDFFFRYTDSTPQQTNTPFLEMLETFKITY